MSTSSIGLRPRGAQGVLAHAELAAAFVPGSSTGHEFFSKPRLTSMVTARSPVSSTPLAGATLMIEAMIRMTIATKMMTGAGVAAPRRKR